MNIFLKIGLFLIVLGIGIGAAKLTYIAPKQDPNILVADKKQVYETIFEWACYREAAIVAYAKLHNVSREQATIAVEKTVKDVKAEKFQTWYENRLKVEKTNG